MAGMKRFVTYIYLYEDGKKGGNAGFAKIEIRGEECRIEIHLRGTYMTHNTCKVYFFKEDAGDMLGFMIGDMKIVSGTGDFGTVIRAGQISGSSYGMNDMEGIVLLSEDSRILLSRWTEGPAIVVDMEHFRIWEPFAGKEKELGPGTGGIQDRSGLHAGNQTAGNMRIPEENVKTTKDVIPPGGGAQPKDVVSAPENSPKSGNISADEDVAATEIPMKNIFPKYDWEDIWEALQQNHRVLAPFENKEAICVRIELKDLRELPKRYWYLGNNSFLLHGFFNYRYLVVGKTEEERWFIGVPGIYQNQERVMASIFGFPEFIPEAPRNNPFDGEFPGMEGGNPAGERVLVEEPVNRFGYWFRYIEE